MSLAPFALSILLATAAVAGEVGSRRDPVPPMVKTLVPVQVCNNVVYTTTVNTGQISCSYSSDYSGGGALAQGDDFSGAGSCNPVMAQVSEVRNECRTEYVVKYVPAVSSPGGSGGGVGDSPPLKPGFGRPVLPLFRPLSGRCRPDRGPHPTD